MRTPIHNAIPTQDRFSGNRLAGAQGFTLAEMLTVITIIGILMSIAVGAMHSTASRSEIAANEIARALNYAHSFAVTRNRTSWVRLAATEEHPHDLELRFYFSADGSNAPDSVEQFRRPVFIEDLTIANALDEFGDRPDIPVEARLDTEGFILFTPAGEAHFAQGLEDEFPSPPAHLRRTIELGIQPTRAGRIGRRLQNEVSALHIQGATGATILYTK